MKKKLTPELKRAKRYVDRLSRDEVVRILKMYRVSNLNPRIGLKWTYLDVWSAINNIENNR